MAMVHAEGCASGIGERGLLADVKIERGLLKESIDILMENAPGHVNLSELTAAMAAVPGVVAVHDLHVWTITSGMIAMSGHVAIQENADPEPILDQLKDLLEHEYEINHTTIQLERENKSRKRNDTCTVL